MYFYNMVPSRAKLGLAFMELAYTLGLVSRGVTGNNWNSTSKIIWTLAWGSGVVLAAAILHFRWFISLAWTEIVNCSLGWHSGQGRIAVHLWEPITPDFMGQQGCGFVAGRINPNAGTAKGKIDPNWWLCLVYKLNWTDLKWEPYCVQLCAWNLFEAIQPECIWSVGDVIPDSEHVFASISHFNLHSI